MVPDYCTKYKENQLILSAWGITTHTQHIWQGSHDYSNLAICYFTSMNNVWYLITVPSMNKITTFVSEISQQTLKIYGKKIHYYSNLAQSKILFYMHQWPMVLNHAPNMKNIHPVIMEECKRMDIQNDRQMDWWTGPIIFPDST